MEGDGCLQKIAEGAEIDPERRLRNTQGGASILLALL